MDALGWTLLFVGLFVLAAGFLGLLGWRLWRSARALAADVARAGEQFGKLAASRADLSELG